MNRDAQIKQMVDRFLMWKLPENFSPDAGISFKECGNEGTPHQYRFEPMGTNLLDATQAEAMIRYIFNIPPPYRDMTFGEAIEALKAGNKVARPGWNGKGMFLYLVPAASYPAGRNTLGTMLGVFPDDMVPYGAYIAMKTAQDNVVPWLASQTDMLAEDWSIVD